MPAPYRYSIKFPFLGAIPILPTDIWSDLKLHKNPPLWAQFFKYGVCGILGLCLFLSLFGTIKYVWPDAFNRSLVSTAELQLHLSLALAAAFIPSNIFSYFSNRFVVFEPGKHSLKKEFLLFSTIATISFIGGEFGKRYMIENGYSDIMAALSFALSSMIINFIARKWLVFKN